MERWKTRSRLIPEPPRLNSTRSYPAERSRRSMPSRTAEKYHLSIWGSSTPRAMVRPEASPDAAEEGTYPRLSASRSTRERVTGETPGSPLSARETVAVETPSDLATSSMLVTGVSP
jgi:hypothetical protein